VALWLFSKRDLDKWSRPQREAFIEMLKQGVTRMTRLRHPRILTVQQAMEESRCVNQSNNQSNIH